MILSKSLHCPVPQVVYLYSAGEVGKGVEDAFLLPRTYLGSSQRQQYHCSYKTLTWEDISSIHTAVKTRGPAYTQRQASSFLALI